MPTPSLRVARLDLSLEVPINSQAVNLHKTPWFSLSASLVEYLPRYLSSKVARSIVDSNATAKRQAESRKPSLMADWALEF